MMPRRFRSDPPSSDYWMTFGDMMTAAVMFLMLVVFGITLIGMKVQGEDPNGNPSTTPGGTPGISTTPAITESPEMTIQKLKKSIVDEINKKIVGSKVDEEGALTLNSDVLFDFNRFVLKQEGKSSIDGFLGAYLDTLFSGPYRSKIEAVVIEGYTDSKGTYDFNLELSQDRALAVARYCIDWVGRNRSAEDLAHFKEILIVSGKSWNRLVINNGKVDDDSSRRVEFKFRIKYEDIFAGVPLTPVASPAD